MSRELVSTHEWDVRAPIELVFDTLADTRTYPAWWSGVYKSAEAQGAPGPGWSSRESVGNPLTTVTSAQTSRITAYERPSKLEVEVEAEHFPAHRIWRLTPEGDGRVIVTLEQHVRTAGLADRLLARMPTFKIHAEYVVDIAKVGLQPYLTARQAQGR